jgi:hypothetical protein
VKRDRDMRLSSLFEVESYAQKVGWGQGFWAHVHSRACNLPRHLRV